jgi:hypothetical protein
MTRLVASVLVVALGGGCLDRAPPKRVDLPRQPYLGLACRKAGIACHRLGVAVWLREPASAVTAIVDGSRVALGTQAGSGAYRRGLFWQGFFADARAKRYCSEFPHELVVRIRISSRDGQALVATGWAPVSCGYG